MSTGLTFGDKTTHVGVDSFIAYPTVADLVGDDLASFAANISSSLSSYATTVVKASNNVISAFDLLSFFKLQYDLAFNSNTPHRSLHHTH